MEILSCQAQQGHPAGSPSNKRELLAGLRSGEGPTCGVALPSLPAPSVLNMWPPPGWRPISSMAARVTSRLPARLVATTCRTCSAVCSVRLCRHQTHTQRVDGCGCGGRGGQQPHKPRPTAWTGNRQPASSLPAPALVDRAAHLEGARVAGVVYDDVEPPAQVLRRSCHHCIHGGGVAHVARHACAKAWWSTA